MKKFDSKLLIDLRYKKGLTQIEIAAILEVDQSSYNRWESGRFQPKVKHLILISNFFGVDFKVFYPPPVKLKE